MWQTKYASAVPKNLGVRVNFHAMRAISSLGVRSPWTLLILDFFPGSTTYVDATKVRPGQETGLGNKGHLQVLNEIKLVLNEHECPR